MVRRYKFNEDLISLQGPHGVLRSFHQNLTCLHAINFRALCGAFGHVTASFCLPAFQGLGVRGEGSGVKVQGSGFKVSGRAGD
jgi:hypothetical protein